LQIYHEYIRRSLQQAFLAMRLFFLKDFLDLVFPRNCELCGRTLFDHEKCLCAICVGILPVTSYHLRASDNDLTDKIKGLSEVRKAMAYLKFTKEGKSQEILHKLKYKNKPQLAQELGLNYGRLLIDSKCLIDWTLIVPVPLHPLKLKRRGYNQSEEFGKGLSEALNIPIENALERIKFTETQTKKTRLERMSNVDEVFGLAAAVSVSNHSVMLVDDVLTTGATMCACANVLLANKAKMVDLVTLAAGGK